jgi:hypothetical protein
MASKIDVDRIGEIHRQIEAVPLRDWDPIGAKKAPKAQDEYREYVRQVFDIAVQTRSKRAVAMHLLRIERERMGLRDFPWRWRRRVPVAQKILALVSDFAPLP